MVDIGWHSSSTTGGDGMGITKRAKKVTVKHIQTEGYYTEYTCPSCNITFKGGGPDKNVLRFVCKGCGQELIVDNKKI